MELLGFYNGVVVRDRWCAVRVAPDQDRVIWGSPPRPCPAESVAAFVAALADDHPQRFDDHYVLIG